MIPIQSPASTNESAAGAPAARHASFGGVLASVVASVLFAVLFVLAPALDGLDANEVFGWRVVASLPLVALIFALTRRWRDVVRVARRLGAHPALIPVMLLNGLLLGVQLWIFGWAPQTGHGLDASLGYLLLPLVMVIVGALLHRERLTGWRIAAVSSAGVGVIAAIVVAGGLAPVTIAIALGYPLYFTLRRRAGLDSSGALVFELTILLPVAIWMLSQASSFTRVAASPSLAIGIVLIGVVSSIALVLYLAASASLPFGLFGLLTYLEPVLLVVVSLTILGEQPHVSDALVYSPIVIALVLLGIEPIRGARR